jgi:hypothetical protein
MWFVIFGHKNSSPAENLKGLPRYGIGHNIIYKDRRMKTKRSVRQKLYNAKTR